MNETWLKAFILACMFGAVLLVVDTLLRGALANRAAGRAINLRLRMIDEGKPQEERMASLRRHASVVPDTLPPLVRHIAIRWERMLIAAQVTMPTGRLMLILLLAPALLLILLVGAVFASGMAVGFGRILLLATIALLIGFVFPLLVLQVRASRARKRMQDQFPVALDVFVRGLRAGHPVAAALELLTVEMPDPIGSEFGGVVDEVTYGADLRDALQSMAERWDLDDIRMFVVSLSVQSETGGNLAEVLENLSRVIRERHSMMLKVRALSSEGRMTAIMLTALPILALTILFIGNPKFYLDVADDGMFVPGFVGLAILYLIGILTIRRMVDLKV